MDTEIVGTILRIMAVAAPAIFVILLVIVYFANRWVWQLASKRTEIESALSALATRVTRFKLMDLQAREDCNQLLASLEEQERRITAVRLSGESLGEEIEEQQTLLAEIAVNRARAQDFLREIDESHLQNSEFEEDLRKNELRLQIMREEMRKVEEKFAPLANLINRSLDYLTNGMKVVVSDSKLEKRETVE